MLGNEHVPAIAIIISPIMIPVLKGHWQKSTRDSLDHLVHGTTRSPSVSRIDQYISEQRTTVVDKSNRGYRNRIHIARRGHFIIYPVWDFIMIHIDAWLSSVIFYLTVVVISWR